MRPIRLTMSAFGSYFKPETIDFTNFYDKGIFLITGPTGAGKTTIFDGICYALYGHTSNSDKDENYIRNDLADGEILTYVELEFELRGNRYYIKRVPKQLRKKLRGDGYTERPAEAELKLIDEDKVITGVTEVNQKVIELIGLEYEQFRQIIMIPQGEFRQLLVAKSKDREEILRKIFGTDEYRKIQEALDKKVKDLKADIDRLKAGLKVNIRGINPGDNDKLKEMLKEMVDKDTVPNIHELTDQLKAQIDGDEREIAELDEKIKILEMEIENILNEITEGKRTNDLLEQRMKIEQEKRDLESKKDEIKLLEESLEKGRKALCIRPLEENYHSSQRKVESKEKELNDLVEQLKKADEDSKQAERELSKQLERNEEADKLKKQMGLLNSFVEKVKDYDAKRKEKDILESQFRDISSRLDESTKNINDIKKKIKELNENRESLKDCEKDYINLKIELEKKEDVHKKLVNLRPLIEGLEIIRENLSKKNAECLSLQKGYDALKAEVENTRRKFIEGYAGKLAKELQEGMPCPVCGSIHHPNPAKLVDGVPSEEELNELEARVVELEAEYSNAKDERNKLDNEYTTKECIINERKNEIKEAIRDNIEENLSEDIVGLEGAELARFIDDKALQFKKQLDYIKSKLKRLEKEIEEKNEIDKKLEDLNSKRESCEKEIEELNRECTQIYGKLESQKSLVQQLEKELPEDIRSELGLKSKIDKLDRQIKQIETDIKKAQEKYQSCRDKYTSLLRAKEEREKALEELMKEREDLKIKFEDQIRVQGFADADEYNKAKLDEEELKRIDGSIRKYNEDLKSVNDRFNQIVAETKDLEPVDITALESKLEEKRQDKDSITNWRTAVYSRRENNEKLLNDIESLVEQISEKEKEYALVGDLCSAANGRNSYKVTFETYVLAAYFEEVIDAANVRLRKMTRNRFQMERAEEEGTGKGYKGLDINVFDGNSGQRRPIKNISGGESFKASLALALGLSDVVQSYAGGIKLDTMFIDEGFGSLDSASLDDAINCLLELQSSGRLVGIISHVKELQERIHSRIEVESSIDGSKIKCVF